MQTDDQDPLLDEACKNIERLIKDMNCAKYMDFEAGKTTTVRLRFAEI